MAAPVVILALALLAGMHAWADLLALVLAAAAGAAWAELSRRTQMTGRGALAPLAVFAALVVGLLAFSGAASPAGGALATWLAWADLPGHGPLPAARVLLLTGLVALQRRDGQHHRAPRAAHHRGPAPVRRHERQRRRRGRRLPDRARRSPDVRASPPTGSRAAGCSGPMERLVILGLGVAGEFGAAGLVIAAKGLLRFPEIQAAARSANGDPAAATNGSYPGGPAGIDDVTEYFLVGSFVSWLIALGSLALTV